MSEAVGWLLDEDGWDRAVLVTDSRSLVDAIRAEKGGPQLRQIREKLWEMEEDGREVQLV